MRLEQTVFGKSWVRGQNLIRRHVDVRTGAFHLAHEHIFFAVVLAAALFWLSATTPFSIKRGILITSLAMISVLPPGWLVTKLLGLDVVSRSARLALICAGGYAASIWLGYLFGVLGVPWAYFVFCLLCLAGWLLYRLQLMARQARADGRVILNLAPWLESRALWIIAGLALLGVIIVAPLMAPLEQINSQQYLDHGDIDAYFHVTRAQLFTIGAPLFTNPELAGLKPVVYPDFHDFWIGQLSAWSRVPVRDLYFVYVPVVTILCQTLVLYAVGRTLTGSPRGGYIAAALAYVVFIPGSYDPSYLVRVGNGLGALSGFSVHFLEFRTNLAYGIAWLLLTGVTLCLALFRKHQDTRTRVGLLILAALLTVIQLRIRSHAFVVMAPPLIIFCVGCLFFLRRWQYILPLAMFGALFAVAYIESTMPYYDSASTRIVLAYGVFGEFARQALPARLAALVARLPDLTQPMASQFLYVLYYIFGFGYSAIVIIWLAFLAKRRSYRNPNPALVYLALVGLTGFGASLVVTLEVWGGAGGGAWAHQALVILRRVILLLAIYPLYKIVCEIERRFPRLRSFSASLVLGFVLLCALITFHGAQGTRVDEYNRAYAMTAGELDTYSWIERNTPIKAIIAANPKHRVNFAGETIGSTNFLSGMTGRAVYAQRLEAYSPQESERRAQLLERLFRTDSVEQANELLQQLPFDYLLVYPDTSPTLDLSCCLKFIRGNNPQLFQHIKP